MRSLWVAVGLALFACLACNREDQGDGKSGGSQPAKVVLAEVSERGVVQDRSFFGNVRASSDATLSAAEAGRVVSVRVSEGDTVEQGELLVVLDDRLARAELSEAVALQERTERESQQASLEGERFEQMRDELAVSELESLRKRSEADSLSAAEKSATAQVQREAERVRRHRIVAPFSGTVTRVAVDPGDWASPGQSAVEMLTDRHLEVEVRVPEVVLEELDSALRVEVEHLDKRVSANIDAAVNALDPETRTALLRVTVPKPPSWLRAGAGVYVMIFVQRQGLTVPRDALVYGVAARRVFKVVDGKAQPVEVQVVAQSSEHAVVSAEGLAVGDRVVVKGNERLRPGQAVETAGALVPGSSDRQGGGQ